MNVMVVGVFRREAEQPGAFLGDRCRLPAGELRERLDPKNGGSAPLLRARSPAACDRPGRLPESPTRLPNPLH
jgi:hypothetical protein